MKLSFASAAFGLLAMLSPANASGKLIINEIMQSNVDCIMDDLNDFPDSWVELYNDSDETVSLQGYAIGLKDKASKAYPLPENVKVKPHKYVLIYCDKAEKNLHTSFRLESTKKGDVYLFKDKAIEDSLLNIPPQPAPNLAYGRSADGGDEWGYMLTPTPGAANKGGVAEGVVGSPLFSLPGGVYATPQSVELSLPDGAPENTVIRYTLDGSEPTAKSALYTEPIALEASGVVRAKLFAPNMVSPRSLTQSYIFHPRETDLAIISIATDHNHLYSNKTGIMSDHMAPDGVQNYMHNWRRPVNVEVFVAGEAESVINQLIEMRLKGATTRGYPLKSMALYPNKRFGEKRLDYEFFPESRPGVTAYPSLELRNGGNDSHRLFLRDSFTQRIMGENCDLDWSAWRPAVVYINGEYYGMMNLRERQNEDNIATHYDGLEDVDVIEDWKVVNEGSGDNFEAFRNFYNEEGHTLDEYREWMDVEEYINHTILYVFFNNVDYPGNNLIMWRPQAEGGKWRWIAKDMDLGIGIYSDLVPQWDFFDFLYHPEKYPERNWAVTPESMVLMKKLFGFPEFRRMFTDRLAVYACDFLTPAKMAALLNEMADIIRVEVKESQKKNSPEWTNFDANLEYALTWLENRHDFLKLYIPEYFGLGQPVALTVNNVADPDDIALSINGIGLRSDVFDGSYFSGSELSVEGVIRSDGMPVERWEVTVTYRSGEKNTWVEQTKTLTLTMPDAQRVDIRRYDFSTSVESIGESEGDQPLDYTQPFEIFDLSGRIATGSDLQTLSPGIYILRQGNATVKHIKR